MESVTFIGIRSLHFFQDFYPWTYELSEDPSNILKLIIAQNVSSSFLKYCAEC